MFHVKHWRWRGRCSGCRVGLAGGVGGPGTGAGHVDTIGYRPGELHVGECKGGTSAKVGTYEVDRARLTGFGCLRGGSPGHGRGFSL